MAAKAHVAAEKTSGLEGHPESTAQQTLPSHPRQRQGRGTLGGGASGDATAHSFLRYEQKRHLGETYEHFALLRVNGHSVDHSKTRATATSSGQSAYQRGVLRCVARSTGRFSHGEAEGLTRRGHQCSGSRVDPREEEASIA